MFDLIHKKFFHFKIFSLIGVLFFATVGCTSPNNDDDIDDENSLYTRLGGQAAIDAVVADFSQRLSADESLAVFFEGLDKAKFNRLLGQHLCLVTGGGCRYTGRDMYTTHKGMGVKNEDFDAVVEHLVTTLNKFDVPQKEADELLAIYVSSIITVRNRLNKEKNKSKIESQRW